MGGDVAAGRFRLGSSVTALIAGTLILPFLIADVPLARLAHQSVNASGGSVPVWVSAAGALVGLVVAIRRPGPGRSATRS